MLLLLPSLLTELLSSSMQPGLYLILSPFVVTMYGVGALLVRELTVRWGKGWPTVLVLGFAYGLCEEGLILKTCFDPKNSDGHSRWLGVNWVWTQNMNVWHAVYSIALPILLTHLAFPARQRESWIGRRGLVMLAALFIADGAFINLVLAKYHPNPIVYPVLLLVIGGLIVAARQLPPALPGPRDPTLRPARPITLFVIGLLATPLNYIIPSAVQGLGAPVVVTLLSSLAYVAIVGWLILHLARRGTGSPLHQFALAAGAYGLYILGSPVAPAWVFLATWHADHVSPQVVFGVGAALYLYWLWRRIRRAQPDTPVSSHEL
jgi:hypothetical protein